MKINDRVKIVSISDEDYYIPYLNCVGKVYTFDLMFTGEEEGWLVVELDEEINGCKFVEVKEEDLQLIVD